MLGRVLAWSLGFWERGLHLLLCQLVHVVVHFGASTVSQIVHGLKVDWHLI